MYKVYQSWEFFTVLGGAGWGGGRKIRKDFTENVLNSKNLLGKESLHPMERD